MKPKASGKPARQWCGRAVCSAGLLLVPAAVGASSPAWNGPAPAARSELVFESRGLHHRFDLRRNDDLLALAELAAVEAGAARAAEQQAARRRLRMRASTALDRMSLDQLKAYYAEPDGGHLRKDRRGWSVLEQLCREATRETNHWARARDVELVQEVAVALQNNGKSPAPVSIEFLHPPLVFLDYSYNPVGIGTTPANNLADADAADASVRDPVPSTFWHRPLSIPRQDLYLGFGRTALPGLADRVWNYAGPKTSYGSSPGFAATDGHRRVKIKFHETTSEPFAARIFAALGYHVEPTDHVPALKLRYDRRYFREFHLRKEVRTEIKILWLVPIYTIELQKRYDPFAFVVAAVLRDGSRIPGAGLKAWLLRHSNGRHPEDEPGNFREDREAALDYLVLAPANVQVRDDDAKSIGPWAFEGLGHEDRRELRAAGLLAAWLGWVDSRFENTRLKAGATSRGPELEHFFTDLGGGLGKATGALTRRGESPNQFPWTCTRPPRAQGRGRMTVPFRITGYEPIQDTLAFERLTWEDARWMGRLIGQLTERQIMEALVASGFDSASVRLYDAKLVSRRDQMIRDLGLADEVGLLGGPATTRHFDYDPATDGPVCLQSTSGITIAAAPGRSRIMNGRLQ